MLTILSNEKNITCIPSMSATRDKDTYCSEATTTTTRRIFSSRRPLRKTSRSDACSNPIPSHHFLKVDYFNIAKTFEK